MDIGKSSIKVGVSRIIAMGAQFLAIAYYARVLEASELGSFFLFLALLGVAHIPANLGVSIAVEKRISEGMPGGNILVTGILLKLLLLIIIGLIILLLSDIINSYIGFNASLLLFIAIISHEFADFYLRLLQGELRVGETAFINVLYISTWTLLGIIFIQFNYGTVGLVYATIIANITQFLFTFRKADTSIGNPSWTMVRSIYEYAKYSIIPSIDSQVHSWMDVLILGLFVSSSAVAAYEIAWQIATPILFLTSAIATTTFPQVSALKSAESMTEIESIISKVMTPSLFFIFPSFFGILLLSEEILFIIYGAEYTIATGVLIILVAGKMPRAIRMIVGKCLLGMDRADLITRAALIDILLNLILNMIFIYQFGIIGAALGTTISMTIGTIIRIKYINEYLSINPNYKEIVWCFVSAVIMYLILRMFDTVFSVMNLTTLLIYITLGVILYILLIVLNNDLRRKGFIQIKKFI